MTVNQDMESDGSAPSLSSFRVSRRQNLIALALATALAAIAIATVPRASQPWAALPGFLPAFIVFVVLTDLLTALLILRDAWMTRSAALTVLGTAYLFTGLIVIPQVMTLPGFAGPVVLFGAGAQTAVWLWIAWHAVFPAAALVFAALRRRDRRLPRPAIAGAALITVLAVAGCSAAAILAVRHLPALIVGSDYHRIADGFGLLMLALAAAAVLALATLPAPRTVAPLWLTVAVFAMFVDVAMTLLGGARFTAGWYVARLGSAATSCVVLIALLLETGRLLASVEQARSRLRSVVDGVGDVLLAVDDRGRVQYANAAAAKLLGGDAAALRGRIAGEVIAASPVPLELGTGDHVLIGRDVTERRRAEAAREDALRAATESAAVTARFLATMSHEIRTPINAVVGMTELMLQTPLTDEARDYALTVRDSAEALLGVINDILDFSKIEAGATEIERAPFSPLAVVENAADILATTARKKGIALATYVAPDVPVRAYGDAHRVRQVLLNLISNAVKFTDRGYVTVRAVVERAVGARVSVVRFDIADTGPGMDAAAAARLFQPFHQGDAATTRRFGGTGLGLSIAKRLVDLMGGEIGFETADGTGSTFWVRLPLERLDEEPAAASEPGVRGAKVLVLDPEPTSRGVLEQYLLAWGAVATATATAAHAYELSRAASLRGNGYDLLVLGEDGESVEALHALARLRGDGSAAPAIFVSGRDEPGQGGIALERGFNAYLRKPLKQSILHDALVDALEGRIARTSVVPAAAAHVHDGVAILVADDNAVNRKLTVQQLLKLGYRADTVTDGVEAVDAVAARPYDLVLMDCEMPELDGYDATRAIRAAEAASGVHVTIVAMTANALAGDRERCLAAGMDDYLAKPVQLAALRGVLERHAPAA